MESKTPVSALQEYCVRMKTTPTYDLVQNGVGTHNPEFIYRVHVNGLSEDGKGKSKQEAKHRAAEKLLKTLNVSGDVEVEIPDQFNNSDLNPSENYVGQLKDYCLAQSCATPVFSVDEEAGPPHSKIFKLTCSVSQLIEHGVSKTKKQAKQLAAYNMLQRLRKASKNRQDLDLGVKSNGSDQPVCKTYIKVPPKSITADELLAKQMALKTGDTEQRGPIVYYKDHQKAYLGLEKSSETLKKVLNEEVAVSSLSALSLLESVAKELGVSLYATTEAVKKQELIFLCLVGEPDWPSISGWGIDENFAAQHVLNSLKILCLD